MRVFFLVTVSWWAAAPVFADDLATLFDRIRVKEKERLAQWEGVQSLQTQYTLAEKSNLEFRSLSRYDFKTNSSLEFKENYIARVKNGRAIELAGMNTHYTFLIKCRTAPEEATRFDVENWDWLLAKCHVDGAAELDMYKALDMNVPVTKTRNSLKRDSLYPSTLVPAPAGQIQVDKIEDIPGYRFKSLGRTSNGDYEIVFGFPAKSFLQGSFEKGNTPRSVTAPVDMVLTINAETLRLTSAKRTGQFEDEAQTFEVKYSEEWDGWTGLPSKIILTSTNVALRDGKSVGGGMNQVEVIEFKYNHLSEADISLSAFKLPEPEGVVIQRPTPIYVWFLAAAGVFTLLAILLLFLVRRRRPGIAPKPLA